MLLLLLPGRERGEARSCSAHLQRRRLRPSGEHENRKVAKKKAKMVEDVENAFDFAAQQLREGREQRSLSLFLSRLPLERRTANPAMASVDASAVSAALAKRREHILANLE